MVILIVVIVGIIGVTVWYVYQSQRKTNDTTQSANNSNNTQASVTTKPSATPTKTDETASWLTYDNKQYGFSFKYPSDFYITPNSGEPFSLAVMNKKYQNTQTEAPGFGITIWKKSSDTPTMTFMEQTVGSGVLPDGSIKECNFAGLKGYCYIQGGMGGNYNNFVTENTKGTQVYAISSPVGVNVGLDFNTWLSTFKLY